MGARPQAPRANGCRRPRVKILIALHGYPPELHGGTELSVQAMARALAAVHEVVVVAGSTDWSEGFRVSESEDVCPRTQARHRVYRIHRADLYFDHWHKSSNPAAARAFAEILRREKPDVVHVQHWIRLSRDLVATATEARIPAVVTLHDLWSSCLLVFRIRPGTRETCTATLAPDPCLDCAGSHPPKTPWVDRTSGEAELAAHKRDLARELKLARAVMAPSRVHGEALEGFLGFEAGALGIQAMAPARELTLQPLPGLPAPLAGEQLRLGAWGNLTALKGSDLLIEAVGRLKQPERIQLIFAGGEVEAGYVDRLQRRAAELGVEAGFHGAFDSDELQHHPVTKVHAMLSGSRAHESWGLVLDEAWCMGLPVILPKSGAFAERLQDEKGGLTYERDDPASLASCIQRLLDEPGLLEKLRGAIPARRDICPSLSQQVQRLEGIYNAAVEAGAPELEQEDSSDARQARENWVEEWDRALSQASPVELGFEPAPDDGDGMDGGGN